MGSWQKVFATELAHRAEIARDVLAVQGIAGIVVNKRDTTYNNFGMYEVHVQIDDVMKALRIIEDVKFE